MDTKTSEVMFSSKSDEWETPDSVFQPLNQEFNFTLDGAATYLNHKVGHYYGFQRDSFVDALLQTPKNERIWLNPPYSQVTEFLQWVDWNRDTNLWVCLLPARTDTKWFHTYCYRTLSVELRFIKGRIKFLNNSKVSNSAPFPSLIAIFY